MSERMTQVLGNLRAAVGPDKWDAFFEAMYDAFGNHDELDGENAVLFEQVQSLKRENDRLRCELDPRAGRAGMMESIAMPLDADRVPVCIGDVMVGPYLEPALVYGVGSGVFFVYDSGDMYRGYDASCYHHQPDTWERIIEDALDGSHDTDFDALVARCKALCERTNCGDAE